MDYGHIPNKKKSKKLSPKQNKNITGVIVNRKLETKIPNKLHLKYKIAKNNYMAHPIKINKQKLDGIKEAMKQIKSAADSDKN